MKKKISKNKKLAKLENVFLIGFGATMGSLFAQFILLIIGLTFFMSGYKIYKKDKDSMVAVALLIIGTAFLLPLIFDVLVYMFAEQILEDIFD